MAAQSGATALTRLDAHETRCTERYDDIRRALQEYQLRRERDHAENRSSRQRLMFIVLSGVAGVFFLIVKEFIVRGIAH